MQMKLYELEGLLNGKCVPGDMKVNETCNLYLVRKFRELEAQVKQLAAANQQLRDENLKSTNALYDVVAENVALKDVVKGVYPNLAIDVSTETVLASLRAEGVDMLSAEYRERLSALPTIKENIFDESHVSLRHVIFVADDFAAQLRSQSEQVKGVQS